MYLSKSDFLKGSQCEKALWLNKHRRNLLPPLSEDKKALFAQGREVGRWAQKAFPEGELIDELKIKIAVELTKACDVDVIFEAAIQSGDHVVRVDVLEKAGDKWNIIEVKSSASCKQEHILDVSYQKWVCEKAGYPVNDCFVMHLNNKYVRKGEVNPKELFTKVNINEDVAEVLDTVPEEALHFLSMLDEDTEPLVPVGPHCTSPYSCDFMGHCWKDVPNTSLHHLRPRLKAEVMDELAEKGITTIDKLPSDIVLTPKQEAFIDLITGNKVLVDKEKLQAYLNKFTFPIYHLDFETVAPAIPLYDGYRPYQKIPFQYSLHIEHEDGTIEHKEFLNTENKDCKLDLLKALLRDLGEAGTILAYYASFEKSVIGELAEEFPEHKEECNALMSRFMDLRDPFAKGMYRDPKFGTSTSLKVVLPVLVPDMSYDDMDIYQGGLASLAYLEMIIEGRKEREKQLLEYCGQDTYAMVKILQVLRNLASGP